MTENVLSYPPVGRCVYCGSTDSLTTEHIIPFSLGGVVKLPKASCLNCCKVTTKFERILARSMYGNLRIRGQYPTRRPKKRPTTIVGEDVVTKQKILFPPNQAIITVPIIHFLPPGIFRDPPEEVLDYIGATIETRHILPETKEKWAKLGSNSYSFDQNVEIDALAMTVAKVAHTQAVAEFGLDNFTAFLPDLILGRKKGVYTYLGKAPEEISDEGLMHSMKLHLGYPAYGSRADYMLLVSVRLFANLNLPTILVAVGMADPKWAHAEALRRQKIC